MNGTKYGQTLPQAIDALVAEVRGLRADLATAEGEIASLRAAQPTEWTEYDETEGIQLVPGRRLHVRATISLEYDDEHPAGGDHIVTFEADAITSYAGEDERPYAFFGSIPDPFSEEWVIPENGVTATTGNNYLIGHYSDGVGEWVIDDNADASVVEVDEETLPIATHYAATPVLLSWQMMEDEDDVIVIFIDSAEPSAAGGYFPTVMATDIFYRWEV